MDQQTKEIYILDNVALYCHSYQDYSIIVRGRYPAKMIKQNTSIPLALLKLKNCHSCLPYFKGKIASSTSKGDNFSCGYLRGKITYKDIEVPRLAGTGARYDLTDLIQKPRSVSITPLWGLWAPKMSQTETCIVIENENPTFIGWNDNEDDLRSIGQLPNLENIRSFIKGTPLEDELL